MTKKLLYLIFGVLIVIAALAHPVAQVLGSWTYMPESATCPGGSSGTDILCASSGDHALAMSLNNASAYQNIGQTFYSSAQLTADSSAFVSVTGLSFPVSASKNYHAVCNVTWNSSSAAAGPKWQFTGPSAYSATNQRAISFITSGTFVSSGVTTFSSAMANTSAAVTSASKFTDVIDLALTMGSTGIGGTVQLQFAANGSGTTTVFTPSWCVVQ